MIAIIGSEGSMGKRYQAILNDLKEPFRCFDKYQSFDEIITAARDFDRIILCTPTHTHFKFLTELIPLCKTILCEKPISKNCDEVDECYSLANKHGCELTMMLQYAEICPTGVPTGLSVYNYYKHGNDGIFWDCMQMIGLATGPVEILETSPIWRCMINGAELGIQDMDWAYLFSVKKWLAGTLNQNYLKIIEMHYKTAEMADSYYGNA